MLLLDSFLDFPTPFIVFAVWFSSPLLRHSLFFSVGALPFFLLWPPSLVGAAPCSHALFCCQLIGFCLVALSVWRDVPKRSALLSVQRFLLLTRFRANFKFLLKDCKISCGDYLILRRPHWREFFIGLVRCGFVFLRSDPCVLLFL